jgi:hypothetical protein
MLERILDQYRALKWAPHLSDSMRSRQSSAACALLQAEGPDASAGLKGHIITRVIIALAVGARISTLRGEWLL